MTYLHSYHKTLGISSINDIVSLKTASLMLYYYDIFAWLHLYFELLKAKDSGYITVCIAFSKINLLTL